MSHWDEELQRCKPMRLEPNKMFCFACVTAVIWVSGLFFLLVRVINFLRLTLNNLAPGANYWALNMNPSEKGYSLSRIDPKLFNQTGQMYFKKLVLRGNLMPAWQITGLALAIWFSSYLAP